MHNVQVALSAIAVSTTSLLPGMNTRDYMSIRSALAFYRILAKRAYISENTVAQAHGLDTWSALEKAKERIPALRDALNPGNPEHLKAILGEWPRWQTV